MNKDLRLLIHLSFILGASLVVLGLGQFLLFLGLDALGVIEVGNALGHGLLLFLSVLLGAPLLIFGLVVSLVARYD